MKYASRLLEEIGVSPDIIDVPGRRIESEKLAVAMQGLWDFLQDEGLALSASKIPLATKARTGFSPREYRSRYAQEKYQADFLKSA